MPERHPGLRILEVGVLIKRGRVREGGFVDGWGGLEGLKGMEIRGGVAL